MSDALRSLGELAQAATALGARDLESAERILASAKPEQAGYLSVVVGAWLGDHAVRRFGAEWVGLSEPVPPRLRLRGVLVSPIDAVRRRLADGGPPLPEIARRIEELGRATAPSLEENRAAWDARAADPAFAGFRGLPDDPESALDEWVRAEGIRGKDVLCLGAGGGRQGPLHAAAGARVTVVDFSERQLDHDRGSGIPLTTLRASIDDLSPLAAASFDVVIQPVSACYVPDVSKVYREVARVLRPGGLYVVQHKQPASLQSEGRPPVVSHPSRDGARLPASSEPHRESGAVEFLHTLDALIGGLCRAGFAIEAFAEPPRGDALAPPGSPEERAGFLPPYLKLKARRSPS